MQFPFVRVRGCSVSADVIDTSPETRSAVLAEYHRAAGEYDRAVARVAAGGTDEDRAALRVV